MGLNLKKINNHLKRNHSEMEKVGYFGPFGGQFIPEILRPALIELETAYSDLQYDTQFQKELKNDLKNYAGRPTPLYYAKNLTNYYNQAKIYLKREDLAHTGAHKINNTIGQILLAKFMGKTRIIAETGAGQHGVATAAVAARAKLECCIYMGEEDMKLDALRRRDQVLGQGADPGSTVDDHSQIGSGVNVDAQGAATVFLGGRSRHRHGPSDSAKGQDDRSIRHYTISIRRLRDDTLSGSTVCEN